MAETALSLINRVLQNTGQNVVTAFSDNDDSNFLLNKVNEALADLYNLNPTTVDADGSVTLPASTRVVNGPSGLDIYRIYNWSFAIDDSEGDIDLEFVTEQFIRDTYPKYDTDTAKNPRFVYIDNNRLAFYPLVEATEPSKTVVFKYPAMASRLTATTDTFPFVDNSDELYYIEFYAQREYELYKGLGNPGVTDDKAMTKRDALDARYMLGKQSGFKGYRIYG